ncbi:MAG: MerR family transcriptional regulator [Stappiaceae bacterium]
MNAAPNKLNAAPDIAGPITGNADDETLKSIADMADHFDVTLRTLRFYEEKGLLAPVRKGTRRFYRQRDIDRMRVILQSKRIGLTLAEIRRVIGLLEGSSPRDDQLAELHTICSSQTDLLREQYEQVRQQLEEVEQVVSQLKDLGS